MTEAIDTLLVAWAKAPKHSADPTMLAMSEAIAGIPEPWSVCLGVHARNLRVGASVFRSYRLPEGQGLEEMQQEARAKLARRLAQAGILPAIPEVARKVSAHIACNDEGRPIGESHHNAGMSDAEVDRIRDLHENNRVGYKRLAKMFDRPVGTIIKICNYTRRAQTPMAFKARKI